MNTMSLHNQKVEQAAQEFKDKGYDVKLEPSQAELPFDLGNYRPDLIAYKGNEGIILEVKGSQARFSVDRYQEVAEEIARHQGWKFLLVTLEDIDERIVPSETNDLPSWHDLASRMGEIRTLFEDGFLEPSLLYLWGSIEAALRKRAIAQKIPIERFPAIKLVNHIYSSAEISISEFELLKSLFEKRNRVAHGLVVSLESTELEKAINCIQKIMDRWQEAE
ncbi:MAG: hypothetical protein SVR94_01785 [Pseudomonadota bacterium]|nr:hypothetical protein [Pseudomonadota bacterium]